MPTAFQALRLFPVKVLLFVFVQIVLYICTKKRDCTVAVPLVKALVLPSNPNKQH